MWCLNSLFKFILWMSYFAPPEFAVSWNLYVSGHHCISDMTSHPLIDIREFPRSQVFNLNNIQVVMLTSERHSLELKNEDDVIKISDSVEGLFKIKVGKQYCLNILTTRCQRLKATARIFIAQFSVLSFHVILHPITTGFICKKLWRHCVISASYQLGLLWYDILCPGV